MKTEILLATLPAASDSDRLQVVLVRSAATTCVCLRQQTWAENIGWYDQKSIELDPEQVGQLRAVLGVTGQSVIPRRRAESAERPATLSFPGTVQVESA